MSNKYFEEGVERNASPPSELTSRKDLFWHGIIVMSWATLEIREVYVHSCGVFSASTLGIT
jgi:hypothetical protein